MSGVVSRLHGRAQAKLPPGLAARHYPRVSDAPERPYLLALASVVCAAAVGAGVFAWGSSHPEAVVVGRAGLHDGVVGAERHAECLDCHVPFVGTPASRCLGPSCHGELATGSPPKTGPAMPVRFHVALRDEPCELCHAEHDDRPDVPPRAFSHDLIPVARQGECRRCHGAASQPAHSRTDAIGCGGCHGFQGWTGRAIDHGKVGELHCDSCHQAPATEIHAGLVSCSTCHDLTSWTPRVPEASPPPTKAPRAPR